MAVDAAIFEPLRRDVSPTPRRGGGRGERRGGGRRGRTSFPPRLPPSQNEPSRTARPLRVRLARAVVVAIAALLALIGPLSSSVMGRASVQRAFAAMQTPAHEADAGTLYTAPFLPKN